MKPLAGYVGYNSEWRELAQVISRVSFFWKINHYWKMLLFNLQIKKDIYMHNPNVKWDDIIGLEAAKRTIKEAVVYPIKVWNCIIKIRVN